MAESPKVNGPKVFHLKDHRTLTPTENLPSQHKKLWEKDRKTAFADAYVAGRKIAADQSLDEYERSVLADPEQRPTIMAARQEIPAGTDGRQLQVLQRAHDFNQSPEFHEATGQAQDSRRDIPFWASTGADVVGTPMARMLPGAAGRIAPTVLDIANMGGQSLGDSWVRGNPTEEVARAGRDAAVDGLTSEQLQIRREGRPGRDLTGQLGQVASTLNSGAGMGVLPGVAAGAPLGAVTGQQTAKMIPPTVWSGVRDAASRATGQGSADYLTPEQEQVSQQQFGQGLGTAAGVGAGGWMGAKALAPAMRTLTPLGAAGPKFLRATPLGVAATSAAGNVGHVGSEYMQALGSDEAAEAMGNDIVQRGIRQETEGAPGLGASAMAAGSAALGNPKALLDQSRASFARAGVYGPDMKGAIQNGVTDQRVAGQHPDVYKGYLESYRSTLRPEDFQGYENPAAAYEAYTDNLAQIAAARQTNANWLGAHNVHPQAPVSAYQKRIDAGQFEHAPDPKSPLAGAYSQLGRDIGGGTAWNPHEGGGGHLADPQNRQPWETAAKRPDFAFKPYNAQPAPAAPAPVAAPGTVAAPK